MSNRIFCFALSVSFGLAIAASPISEARAQDIVAAESLFNQGVAELQTGNLELACPKLRESHRLDPQAGTLFWYAECEARRGHSATALANFNDYLRSSESFSAAQLKKHRSRIEAALEQKKKLEKDVPVVFVEFSSSPPEGFVLIRDEVELGQAALSAALPIDPGSHVFIFKVPGCPDNKQTVEIAAGEKKTLRFDVPEISKTEAPPFQFVQANARLEPSRRPADTLPAAAKVSPSIFLPKSDAQKSLLHEHEVGSSSKLPWVLGGVGVGGLVVGTIMGGLVFHGKSIIDANCQPDKGCNQAGYDAARSGWSYGKASEVAFASGGVLISAGVLVWLIERWKSDKSTNVSLAISTKRVHSK